VGNQWKSGVFVWALALGLGAIQLAGQGSGTLAGTVLDQAGKAVRGAAVTVRNDATGTTQNTISDQEGNYSISSLPLGTYTVEATASGFAKATRTGVSLGAGGAAGISLTLALASIAQTVTVQEAASLAAQSAPVRASLEEESPHAEISQQYIQNFTSPVTDFTNILNMTPGTFSISPNGIGLGQSNIYFRGFPDGDYTMTFDGIPFEDTNTPTHHSWSFFPGQWIGGVDFDRSPGTASTIGPSNFGGSVNLQSRETQPDPAIQATISYGSWDTRLLDMAGNTGTFGNGNSTLWFDVHQMESSGYQTFNKQKRDGGSIKYQYKVSPKTTVTLYTGVIDLWTNTPNFNGATRAQIAEFGDNYLMSGNPADPNYYGYNYYHVQTNFEYLGVKSDLGGGWKFEDKVYGYHYWNKQNYNSQTTFSTATSDSGVDKLNGYTKFGDVVSLSQESRWGIFRVGAWYEWAYTDRYQIPQNPLTTVDALLPNFHEHFVTNSIQPFVEYALKLTSRFTFTAGIKPAYYNMNLDQYQDNGKIAGCVGGGVLSTSKATPTSTCIGGVDFVNHSAGYNSWLPAASTNYRLTRTWSLYGQYAKGNIIPPSAVFDVPGGNVEVTPKPVITNTYQAGTVLRRNRFTVDFDAYYSKFQNTYADYTDPVTFLPIYYLTPDSITKGVEAEGNVVIGWGVNLYANVTTGSAKYVNSDFWVQDTPRNTEGLGFTYLHKNWDLGIFDKRIGSMYNDNGSTHNAVPINPWSLTDFYFNYTIKGSSILRNSKIGFSVNNLFDNHNIVAVTPASTTTSVPSPNDILTLLPGRSVMVSLTVGYAPKR
jgi:iron complex outermembrane recepter protein